MGEGCWSSAQPNFTVKETAVLFSSGLSLKTSLTWLNLPGVCPPVSTALEMTKLHKPLHYDMVWSVVEMKFSNENQIHLLLQITFKKSFFKNSHFHHHNYNTSKKWAKNILTVNNFIVPCVAAYKLHIRHLNQ